MTPDLRADPAPGDARGSGLTLTLQARPGLPDQAWHGTTLSRARRIVEAGFAQPDSDTSSGFGSWFGAGVYLSSSERAAVYWAGAAARSDDPAALVRCRLAVRPALLVTGYPALQRDLGPYGASRTVRAALEAHVGLSAGAPARDLSAALVAAGAGLVALVDLDGPGAHELVLLDLAAVTPLDVVPG